MRKILIVDDHADIRFWLRYKLQQLPQTEIIEAHSGESAAEKLQSETFHLIISDIHMENGTGLWLHDFLTAGKIETPLIFFTSSPEDGPRSPAGNLKAVVSKSEMDRLMSVIKKYV
jgi:CheY-like chemotaxis protein